MVYGFCTDGVRMLYGLCTDRVRILYGWCTDIVRIVYAWCTPSVYLEEIAGNKRPAPAHSACRACSVFY
jgi:hypothetical protein